MIWLQLSASPLRQRNVLLILAICWAWNGAIFHWRHFSLLSWVADYLGWIFLIQAVLLGVFGLFLRTQRCRRVEAKIRLSVIIAVTALAGLPLIQWLNGHRLDQLDWFGTSPDVLTLVTMAMLLPGTMRVWWLAIIPLLWSLFTFVLSWPLGYISGMTVLPLALACAVLLVVDHSVRHEETGKGYD